MIGIVKEDKTISVYISKQKARVLATSLYAVSYLGWQHYFSKNHICPEWHS